MNAEYRPESTIQDSTRYLFGHALKKVNASKRIYKAERKLGKLLDDSPSCRPTCLTNNNGRLFKRVMYNRMLPIAERGLSDKYELHNSKSPVDVIIMMMTRLILQ